MSIINTFHEDFWIKKKLLITGHNGFKGSWLSIWFLMLGANVYGFSLKPDRDKKLFKNIFIDSSDIRNFSGNFFHKTGDIRNLNSLKDLSILLIQSSAVCAQVVTLTSNES